MEISETLEIAKKKNRLKKMPFLQDKLPAILHPMIILTPLQPSNHALRLGESRFGNAPDLPKDFKWPIINDKPATCLAQINLANIKELAPDLPLTAKGHLYFFIENNWSGNVSKGPKCRVILLDASLEMGKETSLTYPLRSNKIYAMPGEVPKELREDIDRIDDDDYTGRLRFDYIERAFRARELIKKFKLKPILSAEWASIPVEEKKIREEVARLQDPFLYSNDCKIDDKGKVQIAKLRTEYMERCFRARELIQKFNMKTLSGLEWTDISDEERKARKEVEQLQDPWFILNRDNKVEEDPKEMYFSLSESLLRDQLKIEQVKDHFSLLGYPLTNQLYDEINDRVLLSLSPSKKLKNAPPEWHWAQLVFFISKADLKEGLFENVRAEHLYD
jgi:uncharacterized protein YwqG